MEFGYEPTVTITPREIEDLFVTDPELSPAQESILWNTYLDKSDAIRFEKVRRYEGMFTAFENIKRWSTIPPSSEYFQQFVRSSMDMCRILGTDVNPNQAMEMYLHSFIVILETQVAFSEKYTDIENILSRKRFAYALEIRSANNTDIPFEERFTLDDVQDYLNSLITAIASFNRSLSRFNVIKGEKAGLEDMASKCVVQGCDMIIACYDRIKIKHAIEIAHYQGLCDALGVVILTN